MFAVWEVLGNWGVNCLLTDGRAPVEVMGIGVMAPPQGEGVQNVSVGMQ